MFQCDKCVSTFSRIDNLKNHIKQYHSNKSDNFLCNVCSTNYTTNFNLKRHLKEVHKLECVTKKQCQAISSDPILPNILRTSPQPSTSRSSPQPSTSRYSPQPRSTSTTQLSTSDSIPNTSSSSSQPLSVATFCNVCNITLLSKKALLGHYRSIKHKDNSLRNYIEDEDINIVDSAFKCRIIAYRVKDKVSHTLIETFLQAIIDKVTKLIILQKDIHNCLKVNMELYATFSKSDNTGVKIYEIKSFNTKNVIVTETTDINEDYSKFKNVIITKSEEFQERGSGWSLEEVLYLEVNINEYVPLKGGLTFRCLPKKIQQTKAVLNILNYDDACFAWSVVAALHKPKGNPTRSSSYPHYENVLNLKGVAFPMALKDIKKFEQNNNLSVNVYGLENKKIVGPLHFSANICNANPHINLQLD